MWTMGFFFISFWSLRVDKGSIFRGWCSYSCAHVRMEARMKKYRQVSPERAKVWTEKSPKYHQNLKVPVIYYLCRNRQLEHPHFMEVPLSSPEGLYLRGTKWKNKTFYLVVYFGYVFILLFFFSLWGIILCADVIDRLNALRGRGMASLYSWSCKRWAIVTFFMSLILMSCSICVLRKEREEGRKNWKKWTLLFPFEF